ncbi:hypothetical protein ACTXT7_014014 [Hymenolepis weldensis]
MYKAALRLRPIHYTDRLPNVVESLHITRNDLPWSFGEVFNAYLGEKSSSVDYSVILLRTSARMMCTCEL